MGIRVTNVTKRFGDFVALDEVSVDIASGSLTALLGPSSAVSEPPGTSRVTSPRATKSPKRLVTLRTSIDIARRLPLWVG